MHSISEVASIAGCTNRALRFYEAKGLIQPQRSSSLKAASRHYTDADVHRICLITAWRSAGLSLTDIKAALIYVDAKDSAAAENLISSRLTFIKGGILEQLSAIERVTSNRMWSGPSARAHKAGLSKKRF